MKATFLFLLFCATAASAAEPGDLQADIPVAGIQRLDFSASAGEVIVKPSADHAVHVHLLLQQQEYSFLGLFHWMSESTSRDLAGATLKLTREADTLKVRLVYPSGGDHSDVKQHWTMQLPAQLALTANMDAGRLQIDGLQGGMQAHLSAGDLTIHSAGGSVQAQVGAGRLHVISDTTQPGKLNLKSTFGLAALSFNGKLYAPPPSEFHFFGNSVQELASGKDNMDLKVTAGEVDLRVGPLVEFKDYRGMFDDSDK